VQVQSVVAACIKIKAHNVAKLQPNEPKSLSLFVFTNRQKEGIIQVENIMIK